MDTCVLGKTGLKVSKLSLGGLFVASFAAQYDEAAQAVRRAAELGVNYVDTAPGYGNSEEVLGKAMKDIKQPLILSTKLGGRPQPFNPKDRTALAKSVDRSLSLLGRDHIDILMIHEPDRPGQYDWWTDWEKVHGPVLDLMEELREKGVVRFLGLGGTTAYELTHIIESGRFDVVLTAFNYSLLWREAALEVIPAARKLGMGIVAGSPLQQGALARRFDEVMDKGVPWLSKARREQFKKLYSLTDDLGISLPELGLRFVLSNPDIHAVLMGARSAREVEQNVAAMEKGPLPKSILGRLDEIADMVPYRPFEEPFGLGWFLADPSKYRGPGMA